jgi:RNA polymerase sigma factor (sigma-70 family)
LDDDRVRHQWVATHILPHEGEVRAWLRRHVHSLSRQDTDDLIQDAYARLWSVDFTHITNARGYLFAIIRNLLLENARRARIVPMERLGEIEMLRIPSEEPGPDRRVSARQELERLERMVAGLPEQCRRAFQLQKFQCLSQREIALKMNITERTVEKYLAIALGRVLDALKQDGEGAMGRPESGNNGHVSKQSTD